jgi:hypothetical protein
MRAPATTFTELRYASGTAAPLGAVFLSGPLAKSTILAISPTTSISNPSSTGLRNTASIRPRRIFAASVRAEGSSRAGEPLAGVRILDVPLLVPDQPTDVEIVAQNPGAANVMAADGCLPPGPSLGTGKAFGIEAAGNDPW